MPIPSVSNHGAVGYQHTPWMQGWLASEEAALDVIAVKRVYIDLCDGNLYDGLVLSQIIFWHGKNKETGKDRLRVFKDGHYWLAKTYQEWWEECRVKDRTARECISRLEKRGLIVTALFKFNGAPTKHVRMDWDAFELAIRHLMSNGNDASCQMDLPSNGSSLTETTGIDHPSKTTSGNKRLEDQNAARPFFDDSWQANQGGEVEQHHSLGQQKDPEPHTPGSGSKEQRSAAAPRRFWKPEDGLRHDRSGWVLLPATDAAHPEDRSTLRQAKAIAVRATQLWLIEQGIRDIEIEEGDRDGQEVVNHLHGAEPLDQALSKGGGLTLRLLRNVAVFYDCVTAAAFNEVLEECFWDAWDDVLRNAA